MVGRDVVLEVEKDASQARAAECSKSAICEC